VNYSFCVIKNPLSGIFITRVSIGHRCEKVKSKTAKIPIKPSKIAVFLAYGKGAKTGFLGP
jgi:hypothetical protein